MPVEFRYREEPNKLELFLDFDFHLFPFKYMPPNEAYELARMDALRLKQMFKLGKLVMKRSDGGAMAHFPDAVLTPREVEIILFASPYVDKGYRYYSINKGGMQTQRTEPKVIVIEDRHGRRLGRRIEGTSPQVREVIR